jgi:two-component system sensor histidine kinase CpxA
MILRLPLLGRILVWLVLNLLLLAVVIGLVLLTEFRIEPLMLGLVGERAQRAAEVLMSELRDRPQSEWEPALARFTNAYSINAILLRDDGQWVAGPKLDVPEEIVRRLRPSGGGSAGPRGERRGPPPGFGGPMDLPPGILPEDLQGPEGGRRPPPQAPRALLRAGDPARYWLVAGGTLFVPRNRGPIRVVLVSDSWSAGGLFFDVRPWVFAGSGAVLLSILWWMPFVRGITRSISGMSRVTETIAEGRFDEQVTDDRGDELGRLGAAINRMAARLDGYVGGQKRFLGDIAHELCSPLARMEMALGVLEQRSDATQREYVEDVREEVRHMSGLVDELLQFSKAGLRAREIPLQAVPLRPLVDRVLDREAPGVAGFLVEVPGGLEVLGDPELLARALGNLVRNALRHAGSAGPITVAAEAFPDASVRLSVADSGPGVPPECLPRLGEPFYRPDLARSRETGGTGLGLAIVKTCVEACQGRLELRNGERCGLVASLVLKSAATSPG